MLNHFITYASLAAQLQFHTSPPVPEEDSNPGATVFHLFTSHPVVSMFCCSTSWITPYHSLPLSIAFPFRILASFELNLLSAVQVPQMRKYVCIYIILFPRKFFPLDILTIIMKILGRHNIKQHREKNGHCPCLKSLNDNDAFIISAANKKTRSVPESEAVEHTRAEDTEHSFVTN